MALRSSSILKSLVILTLTTILLTLPTNTKSHKLVTTRLIHRDSIFSPSYNPSESIEDRAKRMLKISNARFDYLQAKYKRNSIVDDSTVDDAYEANLLSGKSIFLVNFSIGEPRIPQYALMDTGSSLTWIQCKPCIKCFEQRGPIYNPATSSTYVGLLCSDSDCVEACDKGNCPYSIAYLDTASSRGTIGKEQLLFETPDDGITLMHDVIFGCGHLNKHTSNKRVSYESGVFGLGVSDTSIISKLGFGFSYCIGNINDPLYGFNRLTLGNKLKIEGDSTPLESRWGVYYITVEGMSIGQERLDINPQVFQAPDSYGNFMSNVAIDCGATFSYIPQEAYNAVRDKVSSILSGFLTRYELKRSELKLCYEGQLNRDLKGFPDATFHLADGADLAFDIEGLFVQYNNNVVCLALVPVITGRISLIGVLVQQYYSLAFDLNQHKLYLQRIECQLMVD